MKFNVRTRAIIRGVGSTIDLRGRLRRRIVIGVCSDPAADGVNIAADWKRVGNDLTQGMQRMSETRKSCPENGN